MDTLGLFSDHVSVNCLDPGPCHNDKDTYVLEEGICPTPDSTPPLFPPGILSRSSAGIEEAQEWAAPPHSKRSTTGSSYQ
jgi:hypothetical protein